MNTRNGVKWRRFKVPKKVEQINDQFFKNTNKSNIIKNWRELYDEAWSIPEISVLR